MIENEITYKIRGAAFKVHSVLGPGLLESIYEKILIYELEKAGLKSANKYQCRLFMIT